MIAHQTPAEELCGGEPRFEISGATRSRAGDAVSWDRTDARGLSSLRPNSDQPCSIPSGSSRVVLEVETRFQRPSMRSRRMNRSR